jgi:hypothetical protein
MKYIIDDKRKEVTGYLNKEKVFTIIFYNDRYFRMLKDMLEKMNLAG